MKRFWMVLCLLWVGTPVWADGAARVLHVRLESPALAGSTVPGEVVLDRAAPAGGLWVELHAASPAHAPRAVHVPAGQVRAAFSLATDPVETDTAVQVYAMIGGEGPAGRLVLTPNEAGLSAQK